MKHFIFFPILICLSILCLRAQQNNTFYIGHSLSDQIPDMVASLARDEGNTEFMWRYQWIPGAPLRWQWQRIYANDINSTEPHYYPFYDEEFGLRRGDYSNLVMVESVPRNNQYIEETYRYIDSFYQYAIQYNPTIRVFFYEPWHCLLSGTPTGCDYDNDSNLWRQRILDDIPMWESVVDFLNEKYNPSTPVCLIPGGQALGILSDEIGKGNFSEFSNISDIFSDQIHLTDIGKYYIACIHYASILGKSPIGLTNQLQVWWGGDFNAPTESLALQLQTLAWRVVNEYPNSCLQLTSTKQEDISLDYTIIPNPSNDVILIDHPLKITNVKISNLVGQVLLQSNEKQIDIHKLANGIYIVDIDGTRKRIIKN